MLPLKFPGTSGPGEFGGSARSCSKDEITPIPNGQPTPTPVIPVASLDDSQVSFAEFANRYHQNQRKQAQRKRLEKRLRATKLTIGVSARMIRVGLAAQRGLVEALKYEDKASFVTLYNSLHELQESCRPPANDGQLDSLDNRPSLKNKLDGSSDFLHQLSPQSRTDFLDILRLVRSDPQFLVSHIRRLSASQLAAFTAPTSVLDSHEPTFPLNSRSQGPSYLNRSQAQSINSKDHALAFERTDPLSILLFNVFAAPLDLETSDSCLRLEVWSSVCAQLISTADSRYYPLLGQILSSWAIGSNWKARSKLELYLMDILQAGDFLLEPTPPGLDFSMDALDPLRTDVAEQFFSSAVDALFRLLDDTDGGFPHAIFQFAKAVLRKLDTPETHTRFLEFLFIQWFSSNFLYGALTYPEKHGLLLDFHIRKDAREKLLSQVGHRAYSQVFAVLRSIHYSTTSGSRIKSRVENMLSRFQAAMPDSPSSFQTPHPPCRSSSSTFLMISSLDALTLLNALFQQVPPSFHSTAASTGASAWSPSLSSSNDPIFSAGTPSGSALEGLSEKAARIRFELTDLDHPNERLNLENPSDEHWTIFSVAADGQDLTWGLLPYSELDNAQSGSIDNEKMCPIISELEENREALQTAIVRLVKEDYVQDSGNFDTSLKQRFNEAMLNCHHESDFVGAHYWWNASRQLGQRVATIPSRATDDSWILGPMHDSYGRLLSQSQAVIERCERDFVSLDHSLRRIQNQLKNLPRTFSQIRDKMWYMTDVKNSMRYEGAKHVAIALKTMSQSARLFSQRPEENQFRYGSRSFGSSLFQKPEVQVTNLMKASSSQGGPNKLSDEQVELTRKWLSHNGIENFCKGEERIHRFCYEVRISISKLVGETMTEAPVLWASELFQGERSRFEGHGSRPFPGLFMSSVSRPSTTTSESTNHGLSVSGARFPMPDTISRFSQDTPSLTHKPSIQSMISEKSQPQRDLSSVDMSSLGGSSGCAASTSTGDSCSTFWSTSQRHPTYAASVSSAYSGPPSMFSETANRQPGYVERKTHGKTAFLNGLRQTLTSLLLSDLGSPVWSCGSETDAWFTNALGQKRIQEEMRRRAAVHKFYTEDEVRSEHLAKQRGSLLGRRSRSLDDLQEANKSPTTKAPTGVPQPFSEAADQQGFSYKAVFNRLIEVFSRHGNPFVKLNALRDLRSLVIAWLMSSQDLTSTSTSDPKPDDSGTTRGSCHSHRRRRHSFSEMRPCKFARTETVPSSTAQSVTYGSRHFDYSTPSESQIVAAMRDLISEVKPKTIFRDLQFISSFVPGDHLNKVDRGAAFFQFGLAAWSLKEEICHSMVEIADRTISQELSRRRGPSTSNFQSPPARAIQDAAGMWIIAAKEGNPVAQRELAILYLTHPEHLPRVTFPLTLPQDTFKAEMMYRRDKDSKSDPQSMCLALHWMQLSASGGDVLSRNRLREREEFDSIA